MMKMNDQFALRWPGISAVLESTKLATKLKQLASDELVDVGGAIVFKSMEMGKHTRRERFDATGYEAFLNHIHIEDYVDKNNSIDQVLVQGVKYVYALKEHLEQIDKPFRITLSFSPEDIPSVTTRFFMLRPHERPYCSDDPNDYKLDEVAYWDV